MPSLTGNASLNGFLLWASGSRRRSIETVPKSSPHCEFGSRHNRTIGFQPRYATAAYAHVMAITRMSILFRFTERVYITVRQKQRVEQKPHGHGHIRGRALPPWPLGAARGAVRGGRRCGRSRIQSGQGASAQRRRPQEASAARPEAWKRKPTAEVVLRFVRRRAAGTDERQVHARESYRNSNSFRKSGDRESSGPANQVRTCRL
jgi:hypothetical protein